MENARPLIDAGLFRHRLQEALASNGRDYMLTPYTAVQYAAMRLFTTPDGLSGFALDNRELVSVFSHADAPRGRLAGLVRVAQEHGARTLDVFDLGNLPGRYAELGFVETGRVPFDPAQAPATWREELGRPDVVFMSYTPKAMRVLVGCSCSGITRQAFRDLGHDAWSADIKPAEDDSPHHFMGDVRDVLDRGWDIGIFHPTCTYLANSGGRWLYKDGRRWLTIDGEIVENERNEDRWERMRNGVALFNACAEAPIPKKVTENPVMHGHARALITPRWKPQVIQPWMFGHREVKATCLWLDSLPPLVATDNVYAETMALPYAERAKVHYASPGPDRGADRSRALPGISAAMAAQWGGKTGEAA